MKPNDTDLSGVDKIFHQRIREMQHNQETMQNVNLDNINVAEHAIDLKGSAKPFKFAPYRS